jgi:hypothetical protein
MIHRFLRFENRRAPLLAKEQYHARVLRNARAAALILGGSLGAGVLGYRLCGRLPWLDALYNASMILGGMGPVDSRPIDQQPAALKVFASCYALFSGVALLTSVGVMFAPVLHRVLHRFHLERANADEDS